MYIGSILTVDPLRYASSSTATITHLAFSPTQNLLAWTDNGGVLTRWPSPIPSTAPDPVSTPSVFTTTIQGKRRTTLDLFGNGEDPKRDEDITDERDDFGMVDDDWIIDDIGGGIEDYSLERQRLGKEGREGFVKEMGKYETFL
jgi:chromosome transmission fidelity protein 4